MLTLPVTGKLLRQYSSRYVLLGGSLLFNLMMCGIGFVTQTWQLVVVLFCFGCARNLMNISANAQSIAIQQLFDRSIIASLHGIWSVAGFSAAAIGSLLISNRIDTSWHLLAVSLSLTALCFYFFKDTVHQLPKPEERGRKSFALPDKTMLKFGLICFASMACEGTMYDWAAIYLREATGATDGVSSAGYAVYMVAMTLGRFTGDRLANSIGVKAMLRYSGMLMFGGLVMAALFPFTYMAAIGFILIGFGVSCVVPMTFAMAGKVKHMSGGPAIASVSTVGYLGFLIVPPVVGFIAEGFNLRWSFALMSLLGLLVLWMVGRLAVENEPR
jgi:MFS family permease